MKVKYVLTYPLYLIFGALLYTVLFGLTVKWKCWSIAKVNQDKISKNKSAWGFVLHELNNWARGALL